MKPLLICDCDEVLLHMVRHFGAWLDEDHDIAFDLSHGEWARAMQPRDGRTLTPEAMWGYLDGFFPAQMGRQTLVPHARESLEMLAEHAEIVILTNLKDHCRDHRIAQLETHGIVHRVECNQGGKGRPVAQLVEDHRAPVAVFVDDLAQHHESVAREAPHVFRLHMVSEPQLAPHIAPAPHAHARIDDWRDATRWISARFADGRAAPLSTPTEI
jgi:hypothetical protein